LSLFTKNLVLIIVAVIILIVPFIFVRNAAFEGADGIAEEAILEIDQNYKQWAKPLIELPSGEIESLLFSLQAAIGSGIIFFIIGRITAKSKDNYNTKNVENK